MIIKYKSDIKMKLWEDIAKLLNCFSPNPISIHEINENYYFHLNFMNNIFNQFLNFPIQYTQQEKYEYFPFYYNIK